MSVPKVQDDGLRRYGKWAGNREGSKEDLKRCVEQLFDRPHPGGYQCSRPRGHGPDGLYCRQHNPDAIAARRAAKDAEWRAEIESRERARNAAAWREKARDAAEAAIRQIATGHNDPRTLACAVLALFDQAKEVEG